MASLKKSLRKKGYTCIPLKMTKTNHFVLKMTVNGKKGRFILDTGASNSCIGLDQVDYFSLKTTASETTAAGAGAVGMETLKSEGNKMMLDTYKIKNVDLVVFDLSHVNEALKAYKAKTVHGILGADVLKRKQALIDYNKNCLYLKS